MTVQSFYRLSVWLPIALPAVVALVVHGIGFVRTGTGLDEVIQILLMSLVYGGLPYAPIALWATVWISNRPEGEIRRRALYAPLWMIVTVLAFSIVLAMRGAPPGVAVTFFVVAAIASLALGYLYVAMVFGLREMFFGPYERA